MLKDVYMNPNSSFFFGSNYAISEEATRYIRFSINKSKINQILLRRSTHSTLLLIHQHTLIASIVRIVMIWRAILQLTSTGMTRRRSGWRTVVARVVALHVFWRHASAEVVPRHVCDPPEGGEGGYVDELCKVSTLKCMEGESK
jgi:hypothetical protein